MDPVASGASPFNSPLECGLRMLAILDAAADQRPAYDLQRLVFYDYLLVHSGDVEDGPPSLHAATPNRSGEVLVRRHLVERGLLLMISRQLIDRTFSAAGIEYRASTLAKPFLEYLEQPYTQALRDRARWVHARFREYSAEALVRFFSDHLDRWGGEFVLPEPSSADEESA